MIVALTDGLDGRSWEGCRILFGGLHSHAQPLPFAALAMAAATFRVYWEFRATKAPLEILTSGLSTWPHPAECPATAGSTATWT